jgi:hypothetical protein
VSLKQQQQFTFYLVDRSPMLKHERGPIAALVAMITLRTVTLKMWWRTKETVFRARNKAYVQLAV